MRLLLAIILVTQMGCSFITTAAGSFVGNLGADIVEEKLKENKLNIINKYRIIEFTNITILVHSLLY